LIESKQPQRAGCTRKHTRMLAGARLLLVLLGTAHGLTCGHSKPSAVVRKPAVLLSAAGRQSNPLLRQWDRYMLALEAHPMPTKMATAAVLASAGDLIAQRLEKLSAFALGRLLALVAVNVLYITPLLSLLYFVNEWLVGGKLRKPAGTWVGTGLRLAFDQLVNAPLCVFGFFWAFGLANAIAAAATTGVPLPLAGELASATWSKLNVEYVAMMVSNWKIWVAPQIINFALMPPALRVPFASLVALVWNVVQSLIANR